MEISDNRNRINIGGGIYIRPEISLHSVRIEAGFALSEGDLKDFGEIDGAGKDL